MIHVDMDGVVADFDTHYFNHFGVRLNRWPGPDKTDWDAVRSVPNFFSTIPLMPDAERLIRGLGTRSFQMTTGIPKTIDKCDNDKVDWIRANIDPIAGRTVFVACCRAREKCQQGIPGDTLIDDYLKYRDLWIDMGGLFIHHKSAIESLDELLKIEQELSL